VKTGAVTAADWSRSVLAVPLSARRANLELDPAATSADEAASVGIDP
jgi:hypothetical protein